MGSIQEETENELGEVEESSREPENTPQEVVDTPDGEVEYVKGESPRETARRVADKIQSDAEKSPSEEKPVQGKQAKAIQSEPDIAPPDRLKPEAKELFKNLPKGLKKEVLRTISDLEATTTRANQDLRAKEESVRYLTDAIQPFARSWAEKGYSVQQGIVSLANAQEKLTNPATSYQSYVELGVDLGIIPEDQAAQIFAQISGEGGNNFNNPQINTLQQRLDHLEREREQEALNRAAEPIVNEMQAVRQEVNPATGQLRYPELMNGDYLQSLRPRIDRIRGIDPTISWGDALRRANAEHKQEVFGFSTEQVSTQIRPPAASNNISERAAQAAVTVRGRTSPVPIGNQELTPPPEALKYSDPRATARWAYEQLKNR